MSWQMNGTRGRLIFAYLLNLRDYSYQVLKQYVLLRGRGGGFS
jgi:hypothetical protein